MSTVGWAPQTLVTTAKELIHSTNYEKVGEARKLLDDTLSQWVNDITTAQNTDHDSVEVLEEKKKAVSTLWSLYAALEIELRQFKQATKVFEDATSCPVTGTDVDLWMQYASFCVERKKFSNARKVYGRALRAVAIDAQEKVWERFHAFVHQHIDPNLTLETLKVQVLSDQVPTSVKPPSSDSFPTTKASEVDTSLAFIDKTGEMNSKRAPQVEMTSESKRIKSNESVPKVNETHVRDIPTTLPVFAACPYLLFDDAQELASQQPIDSTLLERLSDVLGDSTVFAAVRDLYDAQRDKDRDLLYVWQDMVGRHLKEGGELYVAHKKEKTSIAGVSLTVLATKHQQERQQFELRCQSEQDEFIERHGKERAITLQTQQSALENMKIPEMNVTTDPSQINLQRAILGLILEAERLWRAENTKKKGAAALAAINTGRPIHKKPPSFDKRSRDRGPHRGGGRSGGRMGGRGGGRDYHRRSESPPSRHGGRRRDDYRNSYRGDYRDDYRDEYRGPPRGGAYPPSRQSHHNSSVFQSQSPPPSRGHGYGSGEYRTRDRVEPAYQGSRPPPGSIAVQQDWSRQPPPHQPPPYGGIIAPPSQPERPLVHADARYGAHQPQPSAPYGGRVDGYNRNGQRFVGGANAPPPYAGVPASAMQYTNPPPNYEYPPPQQQQPYNNASQYGAYPNQTQPPLLHQQSPQQPHSHVQQPMYQQPQHQQHRGAPPPSLYQQPPTHQYQQQHHQSLGHDRFPQQSGRGGGRYGRR